MFGRLRLVARVSMMGATEGVCHTVQRQRRFDGLKNNLNSTQKTFVNETKKHDRLILSYTVYYSLLLQCCAGSQSSDSIS